MKSLAQNELAQSLDRALRDPAEHFFAEDGMAPEGHPDREKCLSCGNPRKGHRRFRDVPPQEERDVEYNRIRVRMGFAPNPEE